jgi:hypothetical protein
MAKTRAIERLSGDGDPSIRRGRAWAVGAFSHCCATMAHNARGTSPPVEKMLRTRALKATNLACVVRHILCTMLSRRSTESGKRQLRHKGKDHGHNYANHFDRRVARAIWRGWRLLLEPRKVRIVLCHYCGAYSPVAQTGRKSNARARFGMPYFRVSR